MSHNKCSPINISDYFKSAVINPQGTPEGEQGEASPPSGSEIPPFPDTFFEDKDTRDTAILAAEKTSFQELVSNLNQGLDSAKAIGSFLEGFVSLPVLGDSPELLKVLLDFQNDNKNALPVLEKTANLINNLGLTNIEQIRQLRQWYKDSGIENTINGLVSINNTINSLADADPLQILGQLARSIPSTFPRNALVNSVKRGLNYAQKVIDTYQKVDEVATELVEAAAALVQASQQAIFAACQATGAIKNIISNGSLIWDALKQVSSDIWEKLKASVGTIINKIIGMKVPQASLWVRLQSFSGINWGVDIGNTIEKCVGLFNNAPDPLIANEVLNKIGQVKNKVQQANRGIGTFQSAILGKPGTNPIKNTWASAKSMVAIAPNPVHILSQDVPSLAGLVLPIVVPSNIQQGVDTTGQTSLPSQALTRPVVGADGKIFQAVPSAISNIDNNIKLAEDTDKLAKLSTDLGLSMAEFAKRLKDVSNIYSEEDILDHAQAFIKAAKEIAARQNMALIPSKAGESDVELILIAKEYFECLYRNRPVFRPPGSPDPNTPVLLSSDPNLILYLAFNEAIGTKALSNNSLYPFTVNGNENFSLVAGTSETNNALSLSSFGNLLVNGTSLSKLNLTADFTIEFWLKPSVFSDFSVLAQPSEIVQQSVALRLNKEGVLQLVVYDGTWKVQAQTVSSFVKDEWSKVEVVKSSRKLFIFVKGKKEVEQDFITPVDFSLGLYIGNVNNSKQPFVSEQYVGLIDEFKIFDVAKYVQEHPVPDSPPSGTDSNTDGSNNNSGNNNNSGGNNTAGGGGSNTPINVVTEPPIESDLDPRVTDNPAEIEKQKIEEALSGSGTLPYSPTSIASKNQSNIGLSGAELAQNPLLGLPLNFMSPTQQNVVKSFTDPDVFPEVSEFAEEFLKDDETSQLFSSKYNRLLYVVIALLCRTTAEWEEFKKFKGLDTKILKLKSEPLVAQAHESLYTKTVLQGYGGNSPFIWFAQGARTLKTESMAEILLLFLQHHATEEQVIPVYNWLETNETINFSVPLAFDLNVPEKEAATDSFDYVNTHRQNFASTFTSLRDAADMIGGPLGFEYVVVLAIMLLMTRMQNMIAAKKSHKEVAQVADIAIELTKYLSAKSSILLDLRMLRGF